MAGLLNTRVGGGEEIAWVESVPLARKLNENVLRIWTAGPAGKDARGEDERGE